ncbi:MAG: glutamate-1-semialdehyde 2,1-aminomutase [Chloroflexi bacterium]|nr:glutamate-1-semialdehyde 2,1-aminomutase [Chloroflexota bacterium]
MKDFRNSARLFQEARHYLPGGVDSPVRAFKAVGGTPPFIVRGQGAKIYDADGNEYIDYVGSWGPLVLGHAFPPVVESLKRAAERGTTFGAPTELETTLARMVSEAMPSVEMLRFVNSGTEAVMSALRLARAFTGRDRIIKFAGGYHGHADGLLTRSGSGLATLGIPDSPGVPAGYAQSTLVAPYNSLDAVSGMFETHPGGVAAVIVEPVAANMGVVLPRPGFLAGLRRLTADAGALLIFDEVITGFRVGYGGAQALFKIAPDLTCLGKIIGGGLPVGAFGGRRDIMQMMAPSGPVYQAGTLSGNPLAMTAGIETLKALARPGVYAELESRAAALEQGLAQAAAGRGIPLTLSRIGSLLTAFFTDGPVTDYDSAARSDAARFGRVFHGLLEAGVYWPPSQFEAAFVSLAHTGADIELTVRAFGEALENLR